jgi:hypothetical protein
MARMFIATPCGHSTVSSHYAATLFNLGRVLVGRGVESEISVVSASDLVLVRNQFASTFLGNCAYTHLLFLDSDMSFEAKLVLRMLDFDEDFVSVAYPKRELDLQRLLTDVTLAKSVDGERLDHVISRNMQYNVLPVRKGEEFVFEVRAGFAKVTATGMGLCLLKLRVFEEMVSRGVVQKHLDHQPTSGVPLPYYGFFDTLSDANGNLLSEDYSFCQRWVVGCGGAIWACIDERIGHHGNFNFYGRYVDKLQAKRA